jgi:predicted MPP superfamily phosphohydrolase
MTPHLVNEATLLLLQERVGKAHLQQRLGIERDSEQKIFGQGRNLFHIENWLYSRSFIRNSLRLMLLHGRGRRNARKLVVRHNPITVSSLPAAFNDYTILQISDLHIDMAPDFPHVLIEVLRQVEYDLCVLTGDFRAETFGPYDATLEAMQQVCKHLQGDVYGVLGNHDTICMVPGLESMGVNMLLNEQVALQRGDDTIYLAGVDDPHYYRADNLEKAADPIPNDAVSILLAHSPEIYRNASHANFNVLLCGHTHAGQICLPGGISLMCNAHCPRAFCRGAWHYRGMVGYTSAGSGASIVDVRINCPPEITLHHLQSA